MWISDLQSMSYGASGIALHKYIKESADVILLQVNRNAPYIYGEDNTIHVSEATYIVEYDDKIETVKELPPDDPDILKMSEYLLDQIPDGACIQLGIGGVASAVGYGLTSKNDLGLHTELISDSLMKLMKNGNITNTKKGFMPGKSVVGFSFGSQELYDYLDHNPDFHFARFPVVNNINNIAANDNFISINTAMSVDIFGQVAADNLGFRQQSGTGGQLDFVKGAQMSKGGKSFIAMSSSYLDKNGVRRSKICTTFPAGTAITTPRSMTQYFMTEYGCVNLKCLTMKERIKAIISLAHPDFREQLTDETKHLFR